METTFDRNDVVRSSPSRIACAPRTLRALVDRWACRGVDVPVAIVVSIFDDLLAEAGDGDGDELALDEIAVDELGHASVARPIGAASIAALFFAVLEGDGEAMPAAARALAARAGESADGDQLRGWIRNVLGAPATRDEVCAALAEDEEPLVESDPPEPAPLGSSSPEIEDFELQILTAIPAPAVPIEADPIPDPMPADLELGDASDASYVSSSFSEDAATEPPRPSMRPRTADGRPIIRHVLLRPSASLPAAPAARRSARAALDDHDILAVPGDRMGWRVWALAAVAAILLALIWFKVL